MSRPRRNLYAPSAPFGEAIEAWIRYQEHNACGPLGTAKGIAGITTLAEMARTSTRKLFAYRSGEAPMIELGAADRLAWALDIPLPLLAEEFKPMREWLKDQQVEVAA